MFDIHDHKHFDFKPNTHLRQRTRDFIIDGKVVASESKIQYRHPEYDWWEVLDNHHETVKVKDETELWNNYSLKPNN